MNSSIREFSPVRRAPGNNPQAAPGFILLISVILIAAVAAFIGLSLLVMGGSSEKQALTSDRSMRARASADACAETALDSIRLDENYAGGEQVTFTSGSCAILAVTKSLDGVYTIQTTGTEGTVVRKVRVSANREIPGGTPKVTINSWLEVANF
jgi:hypothetical protein